MSYISCLYRCWRRRRARSRRSSARRIVFSELYFLACTGVRGGEEQDGGDHLRFGLSSLSYISCLYRCWRRRRARWRRSSARRIVFSELYFLACTGVRGGEEQDGGDDLRFGLSSLSYIFLPVQVLEEEKSTMEEIICKKDLSSLSYIFLPVQVLEEEKSKMEEIICVLDCLL